MSIDTKYISIITHDYGDIKTNNDSTFDKPLNFDQEIYIDTLTKLKNCIHYSRVVEANSVYKVNYKYIILLLLIHAARMQLQSQERLTL